MTVEEFEVLKQKAQPHPVFKLDWKHYYPIKFANTFLPDVNAYQCKGVRLYDGAELLKGLRTSPRSLLPLTDSNRLVSFITYTYPKGSEIDFKKERVSVVDNEVLSFLSVDQDEEIDISFKFGSSFKQFLKEQGVTSSHLEERLFKSNVEAVKINFNRTLSHTNMSTLVLDTLGINQDAAYGNGIKGKLESFLKENKIESFIYRNSSSQNTVVTVQGTIVNGWLELKYIDSSQIPAITQLSITSEDPLFAFKKNDKWVQSDLGISVEFNIDDTPITNTPVGVNAINEVDSLVREHIRFDGLEGGEREFEALNKEILKQLNNPFYKDVNLCVKLEIIDKNSNVDMDSNVIDSNGFVNTSSPSKTFKSSFQKQEGLCDITLNILLDENGNLQVKHEVNKDYLQEFEDFWQQEINVRGLKDDISINELRQQVLDDFVSAETERSFFENFIQDSKALLSSKVGGYLEAVQATQKLAKNVWKEGTVNESTWFGKDPLHKEWPSYMQFNPLVGGATDGVIDEIVGIPMAIKGVYGIATDEKQREALVNLFTKQGLKQLFDGLKNEASETLNDEDKLQHFTGKTTVSAATMMVPGLQITKIGKIGEVLDITTDGLKTFIDPKVIKAIDEIKTDTKRLPENLNKKQELDFKKNREETKDFLKDSDNKDIIEDLSEDLSKVLKKGEDASVLKKARNLPGKSSGLGKDIKGKWLKGKEGNAGLFPKSIADKLSGQEFKNFDSFRENFWKAVANDPDLSKQFKPGNIGKMKNGKAPTPVEEQWLGGQMSYILHHKTPINQGGKVYDIDNLYIVTPRFHKEILAPEYHLGYGYK